MAVACQSSPEQDFGARGLDLHEDDICDGLQLHQRVLQWRMDSVDTARFDAQQGLTELRRDQAALSDLQNALAAALRLREAAASQKANSLKLLEESHRRAATSRVRVEEAQRTSARVHEDHEKRLRELAQADDAFAEKRRIASLWKDQVEKFLALYTERLGLAITRIAPQTVRVTFTLIDDAHPEREFSFTLGLAGPVTYSVTDCTVAVPRLDELVRQLNSNADAAFALPAFASSMRRAFKAAAVGTADVAPPIDATLCNVVSRSAAAVE